MIELGSLYTKIEADTSGLNAAIGKVKKFAVVSAKAIAGVSAAASAVVIAGGALVNSVSKQAKEVNNFSRIAGESTEKLQAFSYGTESVGVSMEKLADISKDVQDKIGDFIATGGGEFADFFENVAPKVGLTVNELKNLSGPEALIAVKNAMDQVNVSAKEQVFYLESIANDASALSPLLADNGKKLKEYAAQARELGVVLSDVDTQSLVESAEATRGLGAAIGGLKNKVAIGLAPIYTFFAKNLTKAIGDFNKSFTSEEITTWAKNGSIVTLQFASDIVRGFNDVNKFVNRIIGVLKLASAGAMKLGQGFQWLFEQANRLYGDTAKAEYWAKAQQDSAKLVEDAIKSANESFDSAGKDSEFLVDTRKRIDEIKKDLMMKDSLEKNFVKPWQDANDKVSQSSKALATEQKLTLQQITDKYKESADKINDLNREIADSQLSGEELLRNLERSGMSDFDAWKDIKKQALEYEDIAEQAAEAGDFEKALQFADKASSLFENLNKEVEKGGKTIISGKQGLAEAIKGVQRIIDLRDMALKAQKQNEIATANALAEEAKLHGKTLKTFEDIDKQVRDTTTNSIQQLDGAFTNVWTGGGEIAATVLGNIGTQIDATKQKFQDMFADMKGVQVIIQQGKQEGGAIQALKDGGNVVKAKMGRFFPGFGGGDKIPILGEAGEFMLNKFSVRSAGQDTASAFNRQDWATVVGNLSKKMSLGGPTSPTFSMPSLALANGGSVQNNAMQAGETTRNYYVQGDTSPITVRADETNARKMLAALRRVHMGKRS